jgi:hypothetical protein
MKAVEPAWVLNEDEALELLAFLVTAARTQVDESAEYGPLRLLTAARRLIEVIDPRSSVGTRELVAGPLQRMPLLAVPRADGADMTRAEYVAALDELCRAIAGLLTTRFASVVRPT